MGVRRHRVAQQRTKVGLAGRGGQQIIAAHHLVDALRVIVDHHRDVVGDHTVAAAHHEIIHQAGVFTV
ncbi:Uncharacterised protein [Mycobacteroides abscessus subsp. massiliense]|nr:Uncharacterised protein [Mycobacteroides abscessus subsp. massiliense]